MKRIITVGREFGSGGREFGRRLSEELKIAYYDQEIIAEIAKRTSVSMQYVQQIVEQKPFTSFPIHTGKSFYLPALPVVDQTRTIYQEQKKIIQELAKKTDCVIVGRCADYILQEQKPFRIFVYADMESKIKRCRENASVREHLNDKELEKHIRMVDKNRAKYYEFFTGQHWGDRLNYDLCINTTQTSIKETVGVIAKLF